uniref:2,3-diketo-L-gulonate reductase n=1 Tax=Locusta migratoria migratoria TaxID=238695 RepID=A0A6G5XGD4_LOCMI|nr:2,3-diketo-L-gulonate reductase [Locusta migratoria migratoria]
MCVVVVAGALSGPDIPSTEGSEPKEKEKKKKGKSGKSCPEPPRHACLGMAFLVLDPKAFSEGFEGRVTALLSTLRCAEPVDPSRPVRVPGDFSKKFSEYCDCRGGIPYLKHHRAAMASASPLH